MIGTLLAKHALAGAFQALNDHELEAFMAAWSDDGVFIYPGDIPESGTFRGRAAVTGWFAHFMEQFPTIRFHVREICPGSLFDFVGTNVVAVHWDLDLVNREGHAGQNSGVTVVTLVHGKATKVQDFIFDLGEAFHRNWSALAAAGAPGA